MGGWTETISQTPLISFRKAGYNKKIGVWPHTADLQIEERMDLTELGTTMVTLPGLPNTGRG